MRDTPFLSYNSYFGVENRQGLSFEDDFMYLLFADDTCVYPMKVSGLYLRRDPLDL